MSKTPDSTPDSTPDNTSEKNQQYGQSLATDVPPLQDPALDPDFDYNYSMEQVDVYQLDPALARSVTKALDRRILPLTFCMYLFSALDRGNISQLTLSFCCSLR